MKAGDTDKRRIWAKVLESRNNTGYPYIIFIDTVNRNTVDVYKAKQLRIRHSNLCTEIMLPNTAWWSFVCDLSSMNILYYDDWKNTDAVEMIVYFLDAVMEEFIRKASKIAYMHRAQWFAEAHRALGLGWLGWHSYLQSKNIAWESMEAKLRNVEVAKNIFNAAYAASQKMAKEYGEPELLKGYGRRHTTLMAIAPTTSSSFILGQVSKSIEPFLANFMITDLAKGKFSIKNPYLERLLQEKGQNNERTWDFITKNRGSVQHLNCLNEHEKNVFKTFSEISPMEIIVQAAQRQKYVDQAQSLNLIIDPGIPVKDVNALILNAWELEVKSLYYQFNVNAAQQLARGILTCSSCEA
jgi:ribonucleoside-diphosphate reductase alpha chain